MFATMEVLLHTSGCYSMPQISLGSASLSDQDHDWFVVAYNLCGWSMRSKVSELIEDYVRENREEFAQMVDYSARKYGLTFDEAFAR
ncbi:MAG: hypothetical protein AAGF75_01520, partial [Cyanobacteria bacterium P01_H01_bin.130]